MKNQNKHKNRMMIGGVVVIMIEIMMVVVVVVHSSRNINPFVWNDLSQSPSNKQDCGTSTTTTTSRTSSTKLIITLPISPNPKNFGFDKNSTHYLNPFDAWYHYHPNNNHHENKIRKRLDLIETTPTNDIVIIQCANHLPLDALIHVPTFDPICQDHLID